MKRSGQCHLIVPFHGCWHIYTSYVAVGRLIAYTRMCRPFPPDPFLGHLVIDGTACCCVVACMYVSLRFPRRVAWPLCVYHHSHKFSGRYVPTHLSSPVEWMDVYSEAWWWMRGREKGGIRGVAVRKHRIKHKTVPSDRPGSNHQRDPETVRKQVGQAGRQVSILGMTAFG